MIYLDNQATTPCDPAVIDAISYALKTYIGNPSSSHELGDLASGIVDKAITQIAEIIGGDANQILITSGATESNNLAIFGLASGIPEFSKRKKIITTRIEHKSVSTPIEHLKKAGWNIIYLPLNKDGSIKLEDSAALFDDDVAFVSIQLANSEIGTIQPVQAIAEMSQSVGAVFHCDAAQAVGKIPVNVTSLGVDLLSFSAHKLYGPQGIGALWIRSGFEKLVSPLFHGGGKNTLRPGTVPVALVVGFGVACELITQNFDSHTRYVLALRNQFEDLVRQSISEIIINGSENRLPNSSSITFPDADAEALLNQMPDIIASTGSACESGSIEPSRVLMAIDIKSEAAYSTLRFGFGKFNTEEEINEAANRVIDAYKDIIELSK